MTHTRTAPLNIAPGAAMSDSLRPARVRVTYTRTGYTFTAEPKHGYAADGTLGAVQLHDDGTASYCLSGGRVEPWACATWEAL